MAIKLTPEQHNAIFSRGNNTLVSAAAGSGKTRVVVSRLLERITQEKKNIDEFLIITFTNAAAAELRGRIESELSQKLSENPSDRHLRRQLTLMSRAQITTIDSFCISLVREFSHLCGVIPNFRIVDSAKADILSTEALSSALEQLYHKLNEDSDFASLVSLLSTAKDDRELFSAVKFTYDKVQSHPFPDLWMDNTISAYNISSTEFSETVWGKALLSEAVTSVENAVGVLKHALNLLKDEPQLGEKYSITLLDDIQCAEHFLRAAKKGWDEAVKAARMPVATLKQAPRGYPDPAFRDKIKAMREVWKKVRSTVEESISDTSETHISETLGLLPAVRGLVNAVKTYDAEYKKLKSARGLADFSDTNHLAVQLLCDISDNGIKPSSTAELVSSRYAEIMIDEYQDTNEVQNLLAEVLTAGKNNLFMVGDVKQSIYRFRLAEPAIFLRKYNSFANYKSGDTGVDSRIILSKNFRSRPEVVGAVNSVFEKLMVGGFTQITYGENEKLYCGRELSPDESGNGFDYTSEFCILDVSREADEDEEAPVKLEQEAMFVAGKIRSMLDSGFLIKDGSSLRPVKAGDITILMKSVARKAYYFERALAAVGVDSVSTGSRKSDTAEIVLMISLLTVIDNAYQDIPLVGVLNSPIYNFSSDDLAEVRSAKKSGSMYDAVLAASKAGHEKCKLFLNDMEELRFMAADLGVDKLIWHIYIRTKLPGIYSAMAGGSLRRKNLMKLYEFAVQYTAGSGGDIAGFVNYMDKILKEGNFNSDEAVAGDCVNIMTVHKSKGMEFPVVFFCDLSSEFNRKDLQNNVLIHPSAGIGMKMVDSELLYKYPTAVYTSISTKIKEESLAEEMRVLYVAMTRAKDKLILSCALPNAEKKLASILKNGTDLDPIQLKGANGPAKWLIPIMASHPSGTAIREFCPDLDIDINVSASGSWNIKVESLESVATSSELTESAQDTVQDDPDLVEAIRQRIEFRYQFPELANIPSKITATELKGKSSDDELTEDAATPFVPRRRLRKPRFTLETEGLSATEKGTAIHLAVQFIDLSKCGTMDGTLAEISRLGAMQILSEEQLNEVDPKKILAFVQSHIGIRAFNSPKMKREFKFSFLDRCNKYYAEAPPEEQILVQGVCDMFFEEDDGLVVVDFKSDNVTSASVLQRAESYKPQIDLYADALSRIMGKKVKEKILYFFKISEAVTFLE